MKFLALTHLKSAVSFDAYGLSQWAEDSIPISCFKNVVFIKYTELRFVEPNYRTTNSSFRL